MPVKPEQHKPFSSATKKPWQRDRIKTTDRGYGWHWQKLRRIVIKRDNGLCQLCLRSGRVTQGTQVDHITPKSKGGSDDMSNLQLLCDRCHQHKTATQDSKGWGG